MRKSKTNRSTEEKIRNYSVVNYNRFKKQIEYSYFEKDTQGKWVKKHKQKMIENEVFVPHTDAVVSQISGNKPNLKKDLFGNPILVGITTDFFSKSLPSVVRKCPRRFSYDLQPSTKFLADHFEFDEEKDEIPPLRIHFMDIETVIDDYGFLPGWNVGPDRDGHRGGVTLISSYDNIEDKTYVFGKNPYKDYKNPLPKDVVYVWCKDEKGILREYMKYLKRTDPDILTGWNCSDYDIPYILNRLVYNFGEGSLKHFGNGNAWIKNEARRFIINKLNIVDYMVLYKKFELKPRRSYALAAIVEEEEVEIGGEGKIEYEGSMKDFYTRDWDGFVRYCIQDAKLVYELDSKKKLLETFIMCCYMAGISFDKAIAQDVSWLRIHDSAIYRFCKEKGIELPETKEADTSVTKFTGAFVMEPKSGLYDYVTVFDVASLYPSCIQALNISIEAYRGQVKEGQIPTQKGPYIVEFYSPLWLSLGEYQETLVENHNKYSKDKIDAVAGRPKVFKFETFADLHSFLKKYNLCVAANGAIFTKDFRGVIPSLLDHWIAIRKKNKKLYFEYKQKYQKTGDIKDKNLSDRYNTIQQVYKIRLNSLYGFVGSKWSRFYHTDLAEAVTATGQYVIRSTIDHLKRKNPFFEAMYCDTDSVFLNYGAILKYKGIEISDLNKEQCVQACLEIDKEVKSAIEENLTNITENIMMTPQQYKFESEEVISKLLITSKKKYIAKLVYDKTTNQYPEEDYTIKGMEFKKSNLSTPIKNFLQKITIEIMEGKTREEVIAILRDMFNKMPNMPIDDISYAQGVRSLWKYEKGTNIVINEDAKSAIAYFPKKTPYHIAGALVTNALVEYDPDLRDMGGVSEGDKAKIVFVCPTNIFGVKAITIAGSWHPKLYQYFKLDVEYMMQRLILGPLQPTFDAVKYNITMDDILQFKFVDSNNTKIQLLLF